MTDQQWQAVSALVDPVRRALYDYVRRQGHPVTREEAADAVAISRTLTAFHLDKLVDAGLMHARYEAPAGKARGRGRAPKVYEASQDGVALAVPARRYELVGQILSDAVAQSPGDAPSAALGIAFEYGRRLGESHRIQLDPTRRATRGMEAVAAVLSGLGFEPRAAGEVALGNCPFEAMAQRHPALICGLNEALISGVLEGLDAAPLAARLQPEPGSCCVRVAPVEPPAS